MFTNIKLKHYTDILLLLLLKHKLWFCMIDHTYKIGLKMDVIDSVISNTYSENTALYFLASITVK